MFACIRCICWVLAAWSCRHLKWPYIKTMAISVRVLAVWSGKAHTLIAIVHYNGVSQSSIWFKTSCRLINNHKTQMQSAEEVQQKPTRLSHKRTTAFIGNYSKGGERTNSTWVNPKCTYLHWVLSYSLFLCVHEHKCMHAVT